MHENDQLTPIIRTKLYRPPEPEDIVCRQALHERLDAGLKLPLTLVAAPAGYGKSTAVAHWLEALDIPSAWVSLDEGDGDLGVFLQYFLAAVREMFPAVGTEVQAMLEEVEPVPVGTLAGGLINDLAAVDTSFVLVLDDYYLLGASQVDELFGALLKHPPRALHLVIITRRNPSLPLASLRAQGLMTEVRLRDLEFTQDEMGATFRMHHCCFVMVVAVTEGRLDLGPWQQTFYGEFDGRRPKRIIVKIIGE